MHKEKQLPKRPIAITIIAFILMVISISALIGTIIIYTPSIHFLVPDKERLEYGKQLKFGIPINYFLVVFNIVDLFVAIKLFQLKKIGLYALALTTIIYTIDGVLQDYFRVNWDINPITILQIVFLITIFYYRKLLT